MSDADFKPRDHFTRHGTEKVGFETKRAAKTAARTLVKGEPQVYRCGYCPCWHVGNPTPEAEEAPL